MDKEITGKEFTDEDQGNNLPARKLPTINSAPSDKKCKADDSHKLRNRSEND